MVFSFKTGPIIPINYTNVIPEKQVIFHRKKYDPKI